MKFIKRTIKILLGYNKLKLNLRNLFIDSILHPFALHGHISIKESRFLSELVKEAEQYSGPIVEIGTLFGFSTLVIVMSKAPSRKLITVDNFRWNSANLSSDEHFSLTKEILKEAQENYAVELVNANKSSFYENYLLGPLSLVFFDADHSYDGTLEDLLWARKVGARIVVGHDYNKHHPGVLQAVNEVSNNGPTRLCDSLFVI